MSTVDPTCGFRAGTTPVAAIIGRATELRRRPWSTVVSCWLLVVGCWQFHVEMGVRFFGGFFGGGPQGRGVDTELIQS